MSKKPRSNLQTLAIAAPILLLNGCASFNSEPVEKAPDCHVAPKEPSKFDHLLAFAIDTSKMPPPARAELCRGLVKKQKDAPDHHQLMQLLIGRTLSDSCGDIGKLLEQANAMPVTVYDDESLRQFVSLQLEVLKNMQTVSKRLNSLEKKKKKLQGAAAGLLGDSKETPESVNNETRLLREKLDAIRTMEKQLDGSGDAK